MQEFKSKQGEMHLDSLWVEWLYENLEKITTKALVMVIYSFRILTYMLRYNLEILHFINLRCNIFDLEECSNYHLCFLISFIKD